MHLSQEQLDLISWCSLSEPGDALSNLIWNEFGPKSLESVKEQKFETWRDFISESFPEYLSELGSIE